MAVFRVERTHDYTVMSNYHLRDKRLSLKAKGLLSQMLSLPEDWDYTLTGLSSINRESKDAIRSAVNELEEHGYILRRQMVGADGKFGANEYIIHEKPSSENPTTGNPSTGKPLSENPTQLNTEQQKKEEQRKEQVSTDSISFPFCETERGLEEAKRRESAHLPDLQKIKSQIRENISYASLIEQFPYDQESIEEMVELIAESIWTRKRSLRISGNDIPQEVVKDRFLKLNSEHIQFVMRCLKENTTKVRNIKQYLLAVLFNAPTTISNYYTSLANYDMYGG